MNKAPHSRSFVVRLLLLLVLPGCVYVAGKKPTPPLQPAAPILPGVIAPVLGRDPLPPGSSGFAREPLGHGAMTTTFLLRGSGSVPLHIHPRHDEVAYLISGTAQFTLGDRIHEISAGTVTIIPAGVVHAVEAAGPIEALLTYSPQVLGAADDFVRVVPSVP